MGNAKPIPQGYHTATPYLIIKDAAQAIEFYKKAFGATEVMRFAQPDGKIGHAEIKIGDSHIMLADEFPEMGASAVPRWLAGEYPALRRGRGRTGQAGCGRWCKGRKAGEGSVLRRSVWQL